MPKANKQKTIQEQVISSFNQCSQNLNPKNNSKKTLILWKKATLYCKKRERERKIFESIKMMFSYICMVPSIPKMFVLPTVAGKHHVLTWQVRPKTQKIIICIFLCLFHVNLVICSTRCAKYAMKSLFITRKNKRRGEMNEKVE